MDGSDICTVASPVANKLNLAELPSGYLDWNKIILNNDTDMFVLYLPYILNVQFENTTYFSETFQGVNNPLFQTTTDLSPVAGGGPFDSSFSSFLNGNNTQIGKIWGSMSIKYIVVLTNTTYAGFFFKRSTK